MSISPIISTQNNFNFDKQRISNDTFNSMINNENFETNDIDEQKKDIRTNILSHNLNIRKIEESPPKVPQLSPPPEASSRYSSLKQIDIQTSILSGTIEPVSLLEESEEIVVFQSDSKFNSPRGNAILYEDDLNNNFENIDFNFYARRESDKPLNIDSPLSESKMASSGTPILNLEKCPKAAEINTPSCKVYSYKEKSNEINNQILFEYFNSKTANFSHNEFTLNSSKSDVINIKDEAAEGSYKSDENCTVNPHHLTSIIEEEEVTDHQLSVN